MKDVEADIGEGVAQVPGVVRGHAAHVHPDRLAVACGHEGLEAAATGVVEEEGHAPDSRVGGP